MTADLVVLERAEYAASAAARLADEIERVLDSQERCSLALSGGSTPRPIYERLAMELPDGAHWSRIDIFFGDERCVPPDDSASNYRMVKEALLDRIPPGAARVYRMEGERVDRDAAARDYDAILPSRLDIVVLGLGDDGHTASLFPGALTLAEARRRVVPARAPRPPFDRLTITPPVILDARLIVTLVCGAEKAEALSRALEGPYSPVDTPGQLARAGLWIVDTAAAARLAASRR